MGLFSKMFKKDEKEDEKKIVFAKQTPTMEDAYKKAQDTFNYFWREVYWEYRRIIPAHDLSIVKVPFEQKLEEFDEPIVEHMWINEIDFDGENITGILMNTPNQLTNITNGDSVSIKLSEISDWMFSIGGKTHGGFTIQLLRSDMSEKERKNHDAAWGLDFGDYDAILVAYEQEKHPENLIEHPMSKNMVEKFREFLNNNPDEINTKDDLGYTMLHREAIAGNKAIIDVLKEFNVDFNTRTNQGKVAADFAQALNWEHLIPIFQK
jgi:uncharacterized protein YegJ (DUF2314 family)